MKKSETMPNAIIPQPWPPAGVKPYFCDDAVCILHGDCREIVPLLGKFDLLLTDPPYGMRLNTNNYRFSGGNTGRIRGSGIGTGCGYPIIGDDKPFDPTFMIQHGKKIITWGWNHYADKLPKGACLVWIKRNDEAFGTFLSDAEIAWFNSGCGVFLFKDLSNNSITNERVHPTQKPVSLMKWCIEKAGKDIQTILDPFAGSGTTGRAAKDMGRKAVLIELEEKYCEIAAKRMAQQVLNFGS